MRLEHPAATAAALNGSAIAQRQAASDENASVETQQDSVESCRETRRPMGIKERKDMFLLVERGGRGPLVVLHRDGDADAVLRRTEARRQEGRVLRAAALVHAELLAVVLLAAHHHQVVEQRGLRHAHVSVAWGAA